MKTPEFLQVLKNCLNTVENTLATTIHLINGDKIRYDGDDAENKYAGTFGEIVEY